MPFRDSPVGLPAARKPGTALPMGMALAVFLLTCYFAESRPGLPYPMFWILCLGAGYLAASAVKGDSAYEGEK